MDTMSIYGWFQRPGPTGFGYNSTAEEVTEGLDLSGRAYLVTGSNSGLGRETVRVLAKRGAKVIAAARTLDKAKQSLEGLEVQSMPLKCELSEPGSVREAVAKVKAAGHVLSAIIANAGIMALPKPERAHDIELQLFTNHVGHFMLVTGLLEQLADDGRVVMVSSNAHHAGYREGVRFDDLNASKHYTPWGAYGQSKLANILFARELATRLPRPAQSANAIHPGVIPTNLNRHLPGLLQAGLSALGPAISLKSVPQGAATQVYVATHPGAADVNGEYWADCNVAKSNAWGRDLQMARRLWDVTEAIVAKL
jgi:NAD(P)-dependent dehydrogenase (short-subunit alcohol dehydrogenase family)